MPPVFALDESACTVHPFERAIVADTGGISLHSSATIPTHIHSLRKSPRSGFSCPKLQNPAAVEAGSNYLPTQFAAPIPGTVPRNIPDRARHPMKFDLFFLTVNRSPASLDNVPCNISSSFRRLRARVLYLSNLPPKRAPPRKICTSSAVTIRRIDNSHLKSFRGHILHQLHAVTVIERDAVALKNLLERQSILQPVEPTAQIFIFILAGQIMVLRFTFQRGKERFRMFVGVDCICGF